MNNSEVKRIAVLTSGGDAPGMNAAIRAVVITAEVFGIEVLSFYHGYNGLLSNEITTLNSSNVENIIDLGGTILKSARCERFYADSGLELAAKNLEDLGIDCLIVIGGDGSFRGAEKLATKWDKQVIGIPGTIDNDVKGTDATIGYHTAIETAMQAIDKIRDTADAFERIFLVEVMGRHAGFIALNSAISSGADQVLLPENYIDKPFTKEAVINKVHQSLKLRKNRSYIIVIAENLWPGGAIEMAEIIEAELHVDCRPCILGYIQRGGHPIAQDRILATRLGAAAVKTALAGHNLVMMGEVNHKSVMIPLSTATKNKEKPLNEELLEIQTQIFEVDAR